MDITDLKNEKNKVQRKIEILNGITSFAHSADISLVAEMKEEYSKQLLAIINEEIRIQNKNKRKIKMSLIIYKMLCFGGGIVSLLLFYIIISHKSTNILNNDIFLSLLIMFYVIFSVFNVMVLTEKKSKYAIAIILLVPCMTIITKHLWGCDVFYAINEVNISFALSLYSFFSSLIKDLKKRDKK